MGVGDFNYLNETKTECHCCRKTRNDEKINYNEEGSAKRRLIRSVVEFCGRF